MSHYLPDLPLEERYQHHLDEVNDFNDYRFQMMENLDRQAKVMDRLVTKRQESIATIRHSLLLRGSHCLHEEKRLSGEKQEDGTGRTTPQIPSISMVPDDEELENMLPCQLKRTAVETDLKQFIMVQKQVKQKFEQHSTLLGRRHVQLQVLRMQRPRLEHGGVGHPRRIINDKDEGVRGARVVQSTSNNIIVDDNREHIRIPWQTLLEQPGQNLGLREVNLDMGKTDLRFLLLREFVFSYLAVREWKRERERGRERKKERTTCETNKLDMN